MIRSGAHILQGVEPRNGWMQPNLIIDCGEHRRCYAVLRNGLSRMSGNVPVRFLGEDAPVTTHPYPTQRADTA